MDLKIENIHQKVDALVTTGGYTVNQLEYGAGKRKDCCRCGLIIAVAVQEGLLERWFEYGGSLETAMKILDESTTIDVCEDGLEANLSNKDSLADIKRCSALEARVNPNWWDKLRAPWDYES